MSATVVEQYKSPLDILRVVALVTTVTEATKVTTEVTVHRNNYIYIF